MTFDIVLKKLEKLPSENSELELQELRVKKSPELTSIQEQEEEKEPPLPILRKNTFTFRYPPKCILENINFTQMKKLVLHADE